MGLLGLFGKKDKIPANVRPLEVYLAQRNPAVLVEEVRKSVLRSHAGSEWLYCFADSEVQYMSLMMREGRGVHNAEPIPKCYYKTKLDAKTLLELAYEKGSSRAAFYLGFLYEHGIGLNADQSMADQYYSEAARISGPEGKISLGQMFAKAMVYLKEDHNFHMPNFGASQLECLAIDMVNMWQTDSKYYAPILKIFDGSDSLMKEFVWLGIIAVSNYADSGAKPYSRFVMACLMNNEDIPSRIKSAFLVSSDSEIRKCGRKMLIRLSKNAVAGDQKLVNIMRAHGFPYREVASEN